MLACALLLSCALLLCGEAAVDSALVARRAFDQLVNAQYHDLFSAFSPELQAELPESAISPQVGSRIQALGKPVRIAQPVVARTSERDIVSINVSFDAASFDFEFFVTPDGKIGGLFLRPVQPQHIR